MHMKFKALPFIKLIETSEGKTVFWLYWKKSYIVPQEHVAEIKKFVDQTNITWNLILIVLLLNKWFALGLGIGALVYYYYKRRQFRAFLTEEVSIPKRFYAKVVAEEQARIISCFGIIGMIVLTLSLVTLSTYATVKAENLGEALLFGLLTGMFVCSGCFLSYLLHLKISMRAKA